MISCPNCGAPVTAGARSCAQCGAEVTDPGARTVSIVTEDVSERDALLARLRHELATEYEVERELGRGGMGVVFKAVEIELGRAVALKVLPPGLGHGASAERFRREARMAAALDHPSIIPIYRVGRVAGTYYFAMKLVEGRPLDEIIEQQGALPLQVILAVLRSACSALTFAHEREIVHRDIKGANILVDLDGRVMISDFGIARAGHEKGLTAAGAVMGTPYYMSPEQGWGGTVGPASDQYSLGILAFQMITGQVPFDADSLITILQHHYFTPVPDVRAVRDGLPDSLVQVVATTLRKNPAERFPTTRHLLSAVEAIPSSEEDRAEARETLRQLARGTPVPKVRTGSLPPLDSSHFARLAVTAGLAGGPPGAPQAPPVPAPWGRKRRVAWPALALAVAAGAGGIWWLARRAPPPPPRDGAAAPPAAVTNAASAATARPRARRAAAAPSPVIMYVPMLRPGARIGTLRLYTVPLNAAITVDGERAGTGVLAGYPLEAGPRKVRVSAPGFVPLDTTVRVTAGALSDVGLIALRRQRP